MTLRIGTRGSALARAQTELVARALGVEIDVRVGMGGMNDTPVLARAAAARLEGERWDDAGLAEAAELRVHLAAIGHPLLGDARYGHAPSNRHFVERWALDRVFLHCARIELVHPRTGARLAIAAPLAGDLAIVLARLDASDARRGE